MHPRSTGSSNSPPVRLAGSWAVTGGVAFHRRTRWLVVLLVLAGLGQPAVAAEGSEVGLRSNQEVLAANPELLAALPPLTIEGVVTFVEPTARMLFFHDGTAGIYVQTGESLGALRAGQKLTVNGKAGTGLYAPILLADALVPGEPAEMPAPRPVSLERVLSGALDSQWVEVNGVVRWDGPEWLHRVLQVHDGERAVKVRLQGFERMATNSLLDARVKARGVVGRIHSATGDEPVFTLYSPGPEHLEVLEPAGADPFAAPLVSANQLGAWSLAGRQERLHRVRGVVTFHQPGHWLALRDGETSLVIAGKDTNALSAGQVIEAVGFIAGHGPHQRLTQAFWRATGEQSEVVPKTIESAGELNECPPGELVRIRARLAANGPAAANAGELVLQLGSQLVAARIGNVPTTNEWQPGAEYELTGTYLPESFARGSASFRPGLWLADGSAARWLAPPPEHAQPPDWREAVWLLLLALAVGAWWWQHRRQQRRLDEMEATLAFNRAQLARAESEQARIARDLHDGVIQSIYAVGMRIEECRRLTATAPETAGEKLATTSEVLNHVIRDVRGFLTGLEPASIQGRELKTALKSVLLSLGDEAAGQIALEIETRAAEALTSQEATELFHICKEALSNSLRHGNAGRVEISLRQMPEGCRVEIADDGTGFDPGQVTSPSQGLQNMRSRARNLGVRLQLVTSPGSGTRVSVILPKA
jgi:signal transduction histidine kinase